jgi:hypothetical protein
MVFATWPFGVEPALRPPLSLRGGRIPSQRNHTVGPHSVRGSSKSPAWWPRDTPTRRSPRCWASARGQSRHTYGEASPSWASPRGRQWLPSSSTTDQAGSRHRHPCQTNRWSGPPGQSRFDHRPPRPDHVPSRSCPARIAGARKLQRTPDGPQRDTAQTNSGLLMVAEEHRRRTKVLATITRDQGALPNGATSGHRANPRWSRNEDCSLCVRRILLRPRRVV